MIKKKSSTPGELIFGIHPLIELLKAKKRKVISIYTTKPTPKGWQEVEKHLPKYPVPIQYVSRDVLHRMAETTDHQGIVSWVQPMVIRKKFFEPQKHSVLVLLDGIQDPRNLGAILRSAYCTGVDGVILCKKNSAPLQGVAIKAAAGLSEHLDIYEAPSIQAAIQELQAAKYTIYMATFDGENAMTCEFKTPLCIVIGSEGSGIDRSVLKQGIHVTLPQKTADISYNASVAAGVLLFLVGTKHSKI
jgi:23S rRNA (guanosine2251-2'-O)-methyltransferase